MSPRNPASQSRKPRRLPEEIEAALSPAVQPEPEPIESGVVAVAEPPKPVKPKTKTPKKLEPVSDLLADEIQRERRLAVAREELFFRRHELLADGLDFSVDEFRLLKTAVPKEQFDHFLKREAKRVQTVIGLQSASGKPADRSAADKLAKETAAERDKQAPGIESTIRELQNQLGALHQAATDAKSAADARHEADKNLRDKKLLPAFIRDELDAAHRNHIDDFGKELLQLEGRQISLQSLLSLDVESPEGLDVVKHHVKEQPRFGDDVISRLKHAFQYTAEQRPGGVAHRLEKLRPGIWEDYLGELREELGRVESRIEEIAGGVQAEANRAVDSLRSFYVLK